MSEGNALKRGEVKVKTQEQQGMQDITYHSTTFREASSLDVSQFKAKEQTPINRRLEGNDASTHYHREMNDIIRFLSEEQAGKKESLRMTEGRNKRTLADEQNAWMRDPSQKSSDTLVYMMQGSSNRQDIRHRSNAVKTHGDGPWAQWMKKEVDKHLMRDPNIRWSLARVEYARNEIFNSLSPENKNAYTREQLESNYQEQINMVYQRSSETQKKIFNGLTTYDAKTSNEVQKIEMRYETHKLRQPDKVDSLQRAMEQEIGAKKEARRQRRIPLEQDTQRKLRDHEATVERALSQIRADQDRAFNARGLA